MSKYTTQLGAGLGLLAETTILLDLWQPGMNGTELYRTALESGRFSTLTARRLHDMVIVGFAKRYLVDDGAPAKVLKATKAVAAKREFEQLLFLYTHRAHAILADFVREVYWPAYAANKTLLRNDEALQFVNAAVREGKTTMTWSQQMVRRVAAYLTGCCADFGLLEAGARRVRKILPYHIEPLTATVLAYELHFAGCGDNQVLLDSQWAIFGLQRDDVLSELKRLSLRGSLIVQAAGGVTRIGWRYQNMEELIDGIAQRAV